MIKHWKDLVPEIAEELIVSEKEVEETLELVGKTIKQALREFEYVEYDLFQLGILRVNHTKLKAYIPYMDERPDVQSKFVNLVNMRESLYKDGGKVKVRKREPRKRKKTIIDAK